MIASMTTATISNAKFCDDKFVCLAVLNSENFIVVEEVTDADASFTHDMTLLEANGDALYLIERNSDSGDYGAYKFDSESDARKYFDGERWLYEGQSE